MTEQGVTNLAFENGSESKNGIAKTNHAQNLNSPPSKFDVNEHSTNIPEIKVEERAVWGNSLEFLMSCISMSVGLGNIWRFPFTAYENGGGAFLIPYIIVLILIGKPIYYLEMYLGQFTSRSACKMWNLSPAFKGVGYGQLLAVFSIVSYYTSIIALTFYYLFVSFSSELPWSKCRPEWGSDCVDSQPNATTLHISTGNKSISSSENYFLHDVLKETSDISDGIGLPDWRLTLCLLLSWTIIYLIIIRGVKSSGKAAYFLAIFPYIVILMLLIRAVTLEGAVDGILFFVRPQWDQLLNPKVWYAATTQVFFSLSVGMGTIVMFSSYNHFTHNIYRDAMIVTTLDTFTSAIAGITIFGILGNLAHNLGVSNIDEVVRSGAGLAFISYPDAISKFDVVPQLFAVLFFIMLSVLGVGSVVALQNSIVTVICDKWRSLKYWAVAFGACLAGFLIGLIYVTPGGQWMLNLVDHFGGTFMVFALAIFEIIGVVWVYGLENVCWDLEFMTGTKVSLYWRICWAILTPGLMIIIFVYSMVNLEPLTYSKWEYPDIATAFGWILFSIGLLQVPVWAIWKMAHNKNMSNYQKVRTSFHPNDKWGPANATTRKEWIAFKEEAVQRKLNQSYNHPLWKRKLFVLLGRYK